MHWRSECKLSSRGVLAKCRFFTVSSPIKTITALSAALIDLGISVALPLVLIGKIFTFFLHLAASILLGVLNVDSS